MIAAEPLGERMRGPAIRTYELGRALAPHADVVLASPAGDEPAIARELPVVGFHRADARPLAAELARADVVVAQPTWPHVTAAIRRSGARFVVDLYDPSPFALLETLADRPRAVRRLAETLTLDCIVGALHAADHVMCASEKQRDLWLGVMLAQGLIDPAAYARDPSLRSVIDLVPFGVAGTPPQPGDGPRRGDEELVLWNGGMWDWLDAPTAIRAVAELAPKRPRLRLLFMGAGGSLAAQATAEAHELAGRLGAPVEFHSGWVPYEQRGAWLLDADCAISTHGEHLETRFAFRTRLLDCLWAGLPIVCTEGDELADLVQREQLGAAVPVADHAAVARALDTVLERGKPSYASALARAREAFAWERSAQPLVRWVTDPAPPARGRGSIRFGRGVRDLGLRAALRVTGRRWWPSL
jgi:glycosyltransferase involved in cell wall biosynthesis